MKSTIAVIISVVIFAIMSMVYTMVIKTTFDMVGYHHSEYIPGWAIFFALLTAMFVYLAIDEDRK